VLHNPGVTALAAVTGDEEAIRGNHIFLVEGFMRLHVAACRKAKP